MIRIPDEKKIRVILDTDAACEADDPFAIVHALLSPKLIVKGILAEHFNEKGSVRKSYDEIMTVLDAMDLKIPVLMGEKDPVDAVGWPDAVSEASDYIISEAMNDDPHPLFILCAGGQVSKTGSKSSGLARMEHRKRELLSVNSTQEMMSPPPILCWKAVPTSGWYLLMSIPQSL